MLANPEIEGGAQSESVEHPEKSNDAPREILAGVREKADGIIDSGNTRIESALRSLSATEADMDSIKSEIGPLHARITATQEAATARLETLKKHPKTVEYVGRVIAGESLEEVSRDLSPAIRAAVSEEVDRVRSEANLSAKESEDKTPEDILRALARYSEGYTQAPFEAVADGTFAGMGKLQIRNGKVILIRHAVDREHLIKGGRAATPQELRDSSEFSGGHDTGAVHTSAKIGNTSGYPRYETYGIFEIPVQDFLELAKQQKIILGNVGEQEIVISGDVASKYLTEEHQK